MNKNLLQKTQWSVTLMTENNTQLNATTGQSESSIPQEVCKKKTAHKTTHD